MQPDDTARAVSRDAVLVAALLDGATYECAAEKAGVSKSTVIRRMAEPAFRAHLDGLRRSVLARVADQLASHAIASVAVLVAIMGDDSVNASTRVRAATQVLDSAQRYHDASDLAARVSSIEDTLSNRKRNSK